MRNLSAWIDARVAITKRSPLEEFLNALTHGVAFVAALAATVVLLTQSAASAKAAVALSIYGGSMCAVFAASTLYHGLPVCTAKRVFRLVDHSAIYLMIAGTYTPLALGMQPRWGAPLLVTIWSLCALGLTLNLLLWDRVKPLHLGIYLAMGWLVVLVWEPLGESLAPEQLRWIGIGGVLYTIGVGFYVMKHLPLGHVVWHLFVVAGALALYLGIAHGPIPGLTA